MAPSKGCIPWNAGTSKGWTDKRGYRWIYVEENGRRRAKREHRHVVELALGRQLHPEEVVHHINGDTSDNRIDNLQVTTWSEHTVNHHQGRKRSDLDKRRLAVLATYREDHGRLREINTELLAMLKLAMAALGAEECPPTCTSPWHKEAQAAIAKAEGAGSVMIRGVHFVHECPGDYCAICAWEARKLDAAAWPRRVYHHQKACHCGWCLQHLGDGATVRIGTRAVCEAPGVPDQHAKGSSENG